MMISLKIQLSQMMSIKTMLTLALRVTISQAVTFAALMLNHSCSLTIKIIIPLTMPHQPKQMDLNKKRNQLRMLQRKKLRT